MNKGFGGDPVLRGIEKAEECARRREVPFGRTSSSIYAAWQDYAGATSEAPHPDDCSCEGCEDFDDWLKEPMDRRSVAEVERDEANEMAEARRKWRDWRKAAADEEPPADADAAIAQLLKQQSAILGNRPGTCEACGNALPEDTQRRGRRRKFHPECKEAAMKRRQRGINVMQRPEEPPPYVVPGYTGYRRPPSDAARRIFRSQD